MPRRPPNDDSEVSLFPFLSIIACVIGVLTMMISTLALAQMDVEEFAVLESWEKTQQQLSETDEELAALTDTIAQALGPDGAKVQTELSERQQELNDIQEQQNQLKIQLNARSDKEVVIPTIDEAMRETVASMQAELEKLEQELAQMELELEDRKDTAQSRVSVLPAGSGLKMTPHFLECAQGSIILHTTDPPKLIRAANMVTDEDFIRVLKTVSNGSDDTIIFLIRPEGLPVYQAAKKLCEERDIRHGKLPVAGAGKIDLSRFTKERSK